MFRSPRCVLHASLLVCAIGLSLRCDNYVLGQVRVDPRARPEFSLTVDLPQTRPETKNLLAQVDQHLNQERWAEAIDTLNRLVSNHSDELILAGEDLVDLDSQYTYYVDLKTYLQQRLARFARTSPAFLQAYRQQIDSLAQREIDAAIDAGDIDGLTIAADDYLLSSHADRALLHLGDLLLERGRFGEARGAWERISPRFRTPHDPRGVLLAMPGQPMWIGLDGIDWKSEREYVRQQIDQSEQPTSSPEASHEAILPSCLDSSLPPAAIWARLCLASWLEGSHHRAQVELRILRELHPNATGHFGGKTVNYTEFLSQLLPSPSGIAGDPLLDQWYTYAGRPSRTAIASPLASASNFEPLWQTSISSQSLSSSSGNDDEAMFASLIAESANGLLSTFPIVVGGHVILGDELRVRALSLEDGSSAFRSRSADLGELTDHHHGTFYPEGRVSMDREDLRRPRLPFSDITTKLGTALGASRFTYFAENSLVVARIGNTINGQTNQAAFFQKPASMLVFDMEKEGKLVSILSAGDDPSDTWSFEGTAVLHGDRLYCAVTKTGIRDQSAVACYDWLNERLLWRRTVCLTQPYGTGLVMEGDFGHRSNNLLSLENGVIYYNTNRGVIAAVSAATGTLKWVTQYPRKTLSPTSLGQAHALVQRDLNPCLLAAGTVVAMPLDCDRLFALDSTTGRILWQTVPGGIEPLHLLGATAEDILVSGDQLFWIDLHSGKLRAEFPSAQQTEKGYGRGVLAGDEVLWPTKNKIHRLKSKLPSDGRVRTSAPPIHLERMGEEGGNVLVAKNRLIITGPRKLTVYGPSSNTPSTAP